MNLGTPDEACVCERDGLIGILLEERLDLPPMFAHAQCDFENTLPCKRDDFGRSSSIDSTHQEARFGDDGLTSS